MLEHDCAECGLRCDCDETEMQYCLLCTECAEKIMEDDE